MIRIKIQTKSVLFLLLFLELRWKLTQTAPPQQQQSQKLSHTWPYLPTYDIWGTGTIQQTKKSNQTKNIISTKSNSFNVNSIELGDFKKTVDNSLRKISDAKLKSNSSDFGMARGDKGGKEVGRRRNSKGEFLTIFYILKILYLLK